MGTLDGFSPAGTSDLHALPHPPGRFAPGLAKPSREAALPAKLAGSARG
jgi:hypothetical protein